VIKLSSGEYVIHDIQILNPNDLSKFENNNKTLSEHSKHTDLSFYGGVSTNVENNFKYAWYKTKSGKGTYRDQFGNLYNTTSGIIACIPIQMLTHIPTEYIETFHFNEDFFVNYVSGIIHFNFYQIDTNNDVRITDIEISEGC
jgi:hypothetical protein